MHSYQVNIQVRDEDGRLVGEVNSGRWCHRADEHNPAVAGLANALNDAASKAIREPALQFLQLDARVHHVTGCQMVDVARDKADRAREAEEHDELLRLRAEVEKLRASG